MAGCRLFPGTAAATPHPCTDRYSTARCDAILSAAAEQLGIAEDDVTAVELAPDPTPRSDGILETRGGSAGFTVLLRVGSDTRTAQLCQGIPSGPACSDEPVDWVVRSVIGNGYSDVPCAGEPPAGCASPVPSPDPAAVEGASALSIASRTVAVPSVGHYEVELGRASLPNGVLTEARAELVDPSLPGIRLSSDGLSLTLRSLAPDRPAFSNRYEHGWWPGVEPVAVLLVFDARHVEPASTIELRDIVVR